MSAECIFSAAVVTALLSKNWGARTLFSTYNDVTKFIRTQRKRNTRVKSTRKTVPVVVQELPGYLMAGWTRCMNVLVSCDYQNGSAAGAGKSLAMCFGAIVALSKVLKSVSGVTSLSFHQDRWLPETLTLLFNKALRF